MKQTNFAKALALSVGVLVFSGAASYLIFAWNDGGIPPTGNVDAPLNTGSAAQTKAGDLNIGGNIGFGSNTRQMINLWSTTYGIGIQSSTAYFRTNGNFAFYKGGVHSNSQLDPGSGGTAQMVINSTGNVGIGTASPAAKLDVAGQVKITGGSPAAGKVLTSDANGLATWQTPSGGVTASTCPTDQWAIGIGADGKVICNGGSGTPPWSTVSCTATTDAQLNADNRKRVFVTSGSYNGYATDTVGEVDAICQSEAQSVGLTGTYKALIRLGSTRNPYDVLASNRIFMHCGIESSSPVWREIANSPASFLNTALPSPIKYSPAGALVGGSGGVTVWTNFKPTGGGNLALLAHYWATSTCPGCSPFYNTMYGSSSRNDLGWAYANQYMCGEYSSRGCMSPLRALYCVQQ